MWTYMVHGIIEYLMRRSKMKKDIPKNPKRPIKAIKIPRHSNPSPKNHKTLISCIKNCATDVLIQNNQILFFYYLYNAKEGLSPPLSSPSSPTGCTMAPPSRAAASCQNSTRSYAVVCQRHLAGARQMPFIPTLSKAHLSPSPPVTADPTG